MGIQEWVFKSDRRTAALKWLLRRAGSAGGRLGPKSHLWLEPIREIVQPPLHRITAPRGRALIREKDLIDDGEYLLSVKVDDVEVATALDEYGWSGPNYLSTKKYRVIDGERQYTHFTWVHREELDADWQDHVWAYPAYGDEYTYDLYHHTEPNAISRPQAHTEGPWIPGDGHGVVRGALYVSGIEWGCNDRLLEDADWVLAGE